MDLETVLVTQKFFDDLPEYSCSIPTGTTIGKQWKRGEPYREPRTSWFLGEYIKCDKPDHVGIAWKRIAICPERPKEKTEE